MNRNRIIRSYFFEKVVWITGASSGIGREMAVECVRAGARVILSGRRKDALENLASTLRSGTDASRIAVLELDVTEHRTIATKAEQAVSIFGRIDILVNNAGVSQRALIRDLSYDVADTVIRTDLLGVIDLSLAVLKHMLDAKRGHIVVTSSVMGKISTPYRGSYCAAKYGLHGFFSCLWAESKLDNIDVTVLIPGRVHTNIAVNALDGRGQKHGVTDSGISRGMAASRASLLALTAIARRKFEYYFALTPLLRVGLFLNRFAPAIYWKLISKVKVT